MSEQIAEATATEAEAAPEQQAEQPKPNETVEFWREQAKKQEKRAKENADAAKRLSEIEEASKSEAERTAERLAAAEKAADEARREALRFKIAAKYQVNDDDADLFLTGSDEETLTRQAERLAQRREEDGKPRAPKPDPTQGRQTTVPLDPRAADLAQITADIEASKSRSSR